MRACVVSAWVVGLASTSTFGQTCTWWDHFNQIPPELQPCVYSSSYPYIAETEVFSDVTIVERLVVFKKVSALCFNPIPCDLQVGNEGWRYSTRILKKYTVGAELSVQAAASFAVALVGKVGIEAGFVVSGELYSGGGNHRRGYLELHSPRLL